MKVKMLAALAISGLLAASVAFAAPEVQKADDMNQGSSMQGSDIGTQGQGSSTDMTNPGGSTSSPSSSSDSNSSNSNDDMSADTATGDDDY